MTLVSFENSRRLRLVGTLKVKSPDHIVILVHGYTNDKSSDGRFDYISKCLNDIGFSTLAFDFSGCGESDDDSLTAAKMVDDLNAAVSYAKSMGFKEFALWANSLGTRISLMANPLGAWAMVLTGAATGPIRYKWEEHYSSAQLAELQSHGRMTIKRDHGPRGEVVVDAQMLRDFNEMDQKATLSKIRCPVLIIHGDNDDEERQLTQISQAGLPFLPTGSRIETIKGAKHGFFRYLDRITDLGTDWLTRFKPQPLDVNRSSL